jgi:TetR/AcrR family transcriptional regulator, repressor of fatR-cypB operon
MGLHSLLRAVCNLPYRLLENCPMDADFRPPDLAALDPDTRLRIENAVLEIFSQREFHKVGLIEIARAANVSLQTIYKYYGSKEALLFACLDTWLGRLAARMVDHLQGLEDYKEKLRKVFWVVLDFFEKNPKVAQLIMSSVYINTWRQTEIYRQPKLFGPFLRVLGEGRARGVLSDQVDERILLDYILGVLGRLVQMYIHRSQREPLTAQANVYFEMLWRAIAKPAAAEARPATASRARAAR